MSEIWLTSIQIQGYRSFGPKQEFFFPDKGYNKPIAIVGYNNCGKTNLMNAIRYGIGDKFISHNTFSIKDIHNLMHENSIEIQTNLVASEYEAFDYKGNPFHKSIGGLHTVTTEVEDLEIKAKCKPSFFGANKHYNIFYVNFHNIKDEISTKKTSWGNLTSFLAKHIQKLVETDEKMIAKKEQFKKETRAATTAILENSKIKEFIASIKSNYSQNLRNNNCEVQFVLPDYEDVFLQMVFKIGLNDNMDDLIPIDHFGDGYISMFVMAVIQAIAETETEDKCLFLFEEPESFLHENHQEYFYKMVLCQLASKGHQVIYTTHSDKMVDIFDTQGIIRLEYDEERKCTVNKYNKVADFHPDIDSTYGGLREPVRLANFNSFIKSVEPNLNKILFSKKVVLLEGPNDLMVYRYALEHQLKRIGNEESFTKAYLNFLNISFITHHGKLTALLLVEICNHFGLDYFLVNDWDLPTGNPEGLREFKSLDDLKGSDTYTVSNGEPSSRAHKVAINANWQLLKAAKNGQIHFNIPKLEAVVGYEKDDKSSLGIWEKLLNIEEFQEELFPKHLQHFLEVPEKAEEQIQVDDQDVDWLDDMFL